MPERQITVTVNGARRTSRESTVARWRIFYREDCGLAGTHLGCEHGVCGACTVLLAGEAIRSCLLFAVQADGSEVTTIEGLSPADGSLSPLQRAFADHHGLQCGFCTPGFIVSMTAFLRDNPRPSRTGCPRRSVRKPVPLYRVSGHPGGGK